jgi:hypothetical protein
MNEEVPSRFLKQKSSPYKTHNSPHNEQINWPLRETRKIKSILGEYGRVLISGANKGENFSPCKIYSKRFLGRNQPAHSLEQWEKIASQTILHRMFRQQCSAQSFDIRHIPDHLHTCSPNQILIFGVKIRI